MRDMEVSGVSVDIGRRRLVSDVSFTAGGGELTAIVGVNGIGKSTLLRALAGITAPARGWVVVGDSDIHRIAPRERARMIGFVGQNETPPGDLTVAEFVSLGRLPHSSVWGMRSKETAPAVHAALAKMELLDHAEALCDQLSGGQQRRVSLARGFAQETEVLLLDEPTNHLDVRHQLQLLKLIRESGNTVVANIHDLDLALSHFDRVVVLHDGGVLAVGPTGEVLIPETLRTAFDVQAFVTEVPGARNRHLVIDSL